MLSALIALPFAALVLAPVALNASEQSQFTSPPQSVQTMRFQEMDRNKDGVVTRAEWRGSAQSFQDNDWNGDGILSGAEVRPGAQRPLQRSQEADPWDDRRETFENLDVNRNNRIERHEWGGSADAFAWLDRNEDGVLSRREIAGRRANRRAGERTAAVGSAGTQNCEESAARIVDDIYQQVLERPADQASSGFTQALASGRMTVRDIVAQLAKSQEHANRYFWHPVTSTIYRQILNREPNQQELQETTADLAGGQRQLIDVIARSARRAARTDEEAVRILYRRLLGREADEIGLRSFTEQAGRQGIESVARDIVASAEYRQRVGPTGLQIDDAAYESAVRAVYRHVLGREPDAAAIRSFAETAASSGFAAVVDAIVGSPDYSRVYGDNVVPGRNTRFCGATP